MQAPRAPGIRLPLIHTPRAPMGLGSSPSFLFMPFDALRQQYASAVVAGLIRRSIIASGQLERTIDALEKLILGPLARQR